MLFHVTRYPSLVSFEVVDNDLRIQPTEMQGDIYDFSDVEQFLFQRLHDYYQRDLIIAREIMEEEDIDIFTGSCAAGHCGIFIFNAEKFGKIGKEDVKMMKEVAVEFRRK